MEVEHLQGDVGPAEVGEGGEARRAAGVRQGALVVEDVQVQAHRPHLQVRR